MGMTGTEEYFGMKSNLSQPNIAIFDRHASEYDQWFTGNIFAYQSEVEAIRRLIPHSGTGIEIGAGTGRFSLPYGIKTCIEPSKEMAYIARSRGLSVIRALAEALPFAKSTIDYVLMVTVICFLTDPPAAIKEIRRVLKPGGRLIIGFIDRESPLGRKYEAMKESSKFYRDAAFYSTAQVMDSLKAAGFSDFQVCQTIFTDPKVMTGCDPVREGHGDGGFVALMGSRL